MGRARRARRTRLRRARVRSRVRAWVRAGRLETNVALHVPLTVAILPIGSSRDGRAH